jgi:hypothetical protein
MNAADDIILWSTLALPRIDKPSSVTATDNKNDPLGRLRVIDSFTLFPTLPLELRRKVWVHTITPRIVEVRFDTVTTSSKHDFVADPPIILYICHESRVEGLRAHKCELHTEYSQNMVYFNYERDTLYFREVWQPNPLSVAGDTTPQRLRFVDELPNKDKIRHLMTVRLDLAFWLFPSLEHRVHTEHVYLNNDGDCKTCNFEVRPNRSYFLTEQEQSRVSHYLETSKRGCHVTKEKFASIWDNYAKNFASDYIPQMERMWANSDPILPPRTPLPTVNIQSVFINHITQEQTYCKSNVAHRGDFIEGES